MKSDIQQVRDELFVDTATGKYLGIVGNNLGLKRPIFGFSDDVWRAIIKQIALDYKQIATQMKHLLAIVFGPQKSFVTTLARDAAVGDTSVFVNNIDDIPQIGTITLDSNTVDQETVQYRLINRETKELLLSSALTKAHVYLSADYRDPVLYVNGTTQVITLDQATLLPDTDNRTVIIGRGTDEEELTTIGGPDYVSNIASVFPLTKSHTKLYEPTQISSALSVAYTNANNATEVIEIADITNFKDTGYIRLVSSDFDYQADAGSTTASVNVTVSLTSYELIGYSVLFAGDVTPSLAGVSVNIIDNDISSFLVDPDLPVAPAAGDSFMIIPIVEYTSVDRVANTLALKYPLFGLTFPTGSKVEEIKFLTYLELATVFIEGAGWDMYQVTPRVVDVFLPQDLQDIGDVRSASYLHPELSLSPVSTTVGVDVGSADELAILDAAGYESGAAIIPAFNTLPSYTPLCGMVDVTDGSNTDTLFYNLTNRAELRTQHYIDFAAGIGGNYDTITRHDGVSWKTDGFSTKQIIMIDNSSEVSNNNTPFVVNKVTDTVLYVTGILAGPLTDALDELGIEIITWDLMVFPNNTLANLYVTGDTIETSDPEAGGFDIADGNIWVTDNTFPGPYLYDATRARPSPFTAVDPLVGPLAKPCRLIMSQTPLHSALELESCIEWLTDPSFFPYTISVGKGTGNFETMSVSALSLKDRVAAEGYTLAANASIGDTTITLSATAGTGPASDIPVGIGYRLLLDDGSSKEAVYVIDVDTGTNVLTLEYPLVANHVIGEDIRLMADVASLTDFVGDTHKGHIREYSLRSTATAINPAEAANPKFDSKFFDTAESVGMVYTTISTLFSVIETAGTTNDSVIFNFSGFTPSVETALTSPVSASDTSFDIPDISVFPAAFPFVVTIEPGKYNEEKVKIVGPASGTTFDIEHMFSKAHSSGSEVVFETSKEEVIPYSDVFNSSFMVKYTHNPYEAVILSKGKSIPRSDGYSFPLRLPSDVRVRLKYMMDLVRAAGVQVNFIFKR